MNPALPFLLAAAALASAAPARAQDDILLRQPNGSYLRANPGGAGGPYYARPTGDAASALYDKRGDRVGTVKGGPGGVRLYDNRGDRIK